MPSPSAAAAPVTRLPAPVEPVAETSMEAALLRVSVDLAHRYPRDEAAVLARVVAMIDAFPQFAEKALYSIPYEDRRSGRTVRVEGMTIRAAETLSTAWGHIRVAVRTAAEDEGWYELEAMAWDAQTNYSNFAPHRVSKLEKQRDGRVIMLDDRRMTMALHAGISKAKRNVLLGVLPLHLKAAFEQKVREKLAGGDLAKAVPAEIIERVLTAFGGLGVTKARLEGHVGKPVGLWVGADVADLRVLFSSIEDGEVQLAEVFPPVAPVEPAPGAAATVVEARDAAIVTPPREDAPAPAAPAPAGNGKARRPAKATAQPPLPEQDAAPVAAAPPPPRRRPRPPWPRPRRRPAPWTRGSRRSRRAPPSTTSTRWWAACIPTRRT